ncbi:MAG: GNAT family N-acetyltransferase [Acidobacteriia bacterium]|nr:GNAT family N-acetyltransferase [Terriglobia bacterium]
MFVEIVGDGQSVKLIAPGRFKDNSSAPANRGQFTARIFTGVNPFRELASECAGVEEFTTTPMQSHIWNLACAESFPDGGPVLVTVQRQGKTVAFAPLFRPRGQKRLLFLGQSLFEPTLFAYADDESCYALAQALLKLKDPIFLRDVDASSPMVPALQQACRAGKRVCITRSMPSHPWLRLNESWRRPEEHLNSGRRSDLRRARRIAEKNGLLTFLNINPAPAELDELLTEVFRVESANWKGKAGSGLAHDPAIQGFFRRYCQLACEQGILRILLMRCDDQTAAVQLGVDYKQRFWLLKMGYDQHFARCSPGELLMVESLRFAAERGLEGFEFTGTRESWTHKWTDMAHPSVSVRIYAAGFHGPMEFAVEITKAAARRAAKLLLRKKTEEAK